MEAGGQEDNPLRTGAVAPCLADAPHQEFSAKGETQTWTPDGPTWMEHPEDRMSCQCRCGRRSKVGLDQRRWCPHCERRIGIQGCHCWFDDWAMCHCCGDPDAWDAWCIYSNT
jgi:hypothetical protein